MLGFMRKMVERRAEPRAAIERKIVFVTHSGVTCEGVARNISKEALLLVSDQRAPVSVNETGELIIDYKGIHSVFPGLVTRSDKYSVDKYCVAVRFGSQETIDFFDPWIVSSGRCYNCGSFDNLEKCPQCRGIQTICAVCAMRDTICRACRADGYLQDSKNA
ncbi:MAG: hypothetical protein HQL88_07770 [Magnetococcales bacterium]|nr:hypothetical protein [Magnetococcales bacterium]